jgi:hypothetical protein
MIGTAVEVALWRVTYRYKNPELAEKPDAQPWVGIDDVMVVTADPSGADLFDVVRSNVERGLGKPAELFSVVHSARMGAGIRGLATLAEPGDQHRWHPEAGALLAKATLARVDADRARQRAELAEQRLRELEDAVIWYLRQRGIHYDDADAFLSRCREHGFASREPAIDAALGRRG